MIFVHCMVEGVACGKKYNAANARLLDEFGFNFQFPVLKGINIGIRDIAIVAMDIDKNGIFGVIVGTIHPRECSFNALLAKDIAKEGV